MRGVSGDSILKYFQGTREIKELQGAIREPPGP
jgi:hypothetical protein